MARKDLYLDHLASVPLFSTCSRKELQSIARVSTELAVPAGDVLVKQGDQGQECFVVVDGTATVRRNGRKIADVGPGAYVGEISLLDKGKRSATVTADTPMTLLVLSPREFASLLDQVPSMAIKLLRVLAGRVRELDKQAYG